MSTLPSKSRITLWKSVSLQLDSHFGYRHKEISGPCSYVIEQLEDTELLSNLVTVTFIEEFLEAMKIVRHGTRLNHFLWHETPHLNRSFVLWWADLDNNTIKEKRGYLTDDVREAYLEAALNTEIFTLDRESLKQSHQRLRQARDQASETTPEWGAMYHVLRIFEATLVHVARQHPATRLRIEKTFVDAHSSSNREVMIDRTYAQALASNRRWQQAIGLLEPEATVHYLFGGNKT